MKALLKTSILLTVFFCASSVHAQSAGWIAGDKADDIETFYRFEKTGSKTYEVEVKTINQRAKAVDVIVKIVPERTQNKPQGTQNNNNNSAYVKLTVKAKETSVSPKVEIEASGIQTVILTCWSNTDSQKKCELPSKELIPIRITP
jgi:hypothetical protein